MAAEPTRVRPGPRRKEHLAAVGRHALTHGMTAKKHGVLDCEDPAAFKALRDDIRRELQVVGRLETGFADQVVLCLWELDRGARIQSAVMDQAYQDTISAGKEHFTPAERFRRALIAAINNDWLPNVTRYKKDVERSLFRFLHELQTLQASRLLKVPMTPGALRISLTVPPLDLQPPDIA